MKLKLILGVLSFSLLSHFAQAYPANGLLGFWHTSYPIYQPGVSFNLEFSFFANQAQLRVHCNYQDGAYLSAVVTNYADYNWNQIYVQPGYRAVANDGYHYCEASLQPGTWIAQFDQYGQMILTAPVPYRTQFVLVRSY